MDNKALSIVSYITLFGWLISFVIGKEKSNSLLKYHLKQSLGLIIFSIVLSIILNILMMVTKIGILGIFGFIPLVLMIIGIINAANNVEKPLPLIGKMFEGKFSFIG
ncbi:import component protein [Chryseobacterium sp. MYb7]|uniref:import component protein n=1 Tax=Chryseobacterium sp. MYb7 TaxID=1827290 RepID=UPI000D0112C5|nr:import component protein [Chryseobacterium sp. MYb7]PRB02441.1 import component protein [Chryseobacterium sp. MYb7]